MSAGRSEIGRMYDVADDHETEVLNALREKAGLTWECRDDAGFSHWTNAEDDEVCGACGKPKPDKGA